MIMPCSGDEIRTTGGQVDALTLALIEALCDKDVDTEEIIENSLVELGKKKAALVLSSSCYYLKKNAKLPISHRVAILRSMEIILKETLKDLDLQLALDLIHQASSELTQSKDVVPDWQTAASGVLVAIGRNYCNEVMEDLMQKFKPGALPHFFIVQTLANLASANVFDMLPHINSILGALLPMLGMAKQDNMKWVFCSALQKFSEAILEYVANIEKAPDPTVTKGRFSGEIFAAYDILFNVWLTTKESKLRLAIIEAVGPMTHLMQKEQLEEQLSKMLNGFLGLYKKQHIHFYITQGLCMVLDAACTEKNSVLEPHLDHLYAALFSQICAPVDYSNTLLVKNYNEVLRCFTVLARGFSARLVGILLQKLEGNNEKNRIGILSILKHIINTSGSSMEDMKQTVLSGLNILLSETNKKVKKMFSQVVIAMAHHGYLEQEGGLVMIEFIIRQCCLVDEPASKRPYDPEQVSSEALRKLCDNILHLISTTIDIMEPVLWPFLLEYIIPEQYTLAMKPVCRSLAHLAAKKRESNAEDFDLDYDEQINIPKPHEIIARLLVMVGSPMNGDGRGIHVLNLMKALIPNLSETLVELWDTVIPKLISYIEENAEENDVEKWNQKSWEDLLLKLLSKSLDIIDDEKWIKQLGEAFGQQIPLYNNFPEEKNFLYKCLGIVLRKSTMKDFISQHINLMFSLVKHTEKAEREGCAVAMGFAATSHLDSVLSKLESVTKNDIVRKSSGILAFMRDKSEVNIERMKATLILCYGYVAFYCPSSLLVSRLETTIMRSIQPHFISPKDVSVKLSLIQTSDLIGQALHPDKLKAFYNFMNRRELLGHMQMYMMRESKESITNEIRSQALTTCSTLVKLSPQMTDADVYDLLETAIGSIFRLPLEGTSRKKGKEETYKEHLESEVLLHNTKEALHNLLREIVNKDLSTNGLEVIFKHLVHWMASGQEYQREWALETWLLILNYFLEKIGSGSSMRLDNLGFLLAHLIPRCSDPVHEVQKKALDCVKGLLTIHLKLEGNNTDGGELENTFSTLKEKAKRTDSNVLFVMASDLAKVVAKKLPEKQLMPFFDGLEVCLADAQSHGSSGACVMLNGLMKQRGTELRDHVGKIIEALHERLFQIQHSQSKAGTLRAVRTIVSHHLPLALKVLLSFPLPYDSIVCAIWQCLAEDTQLTLGIVQDLLERLQTQRPYEEKANNQKQRQRQALIGPLAILSAFRELFLIQQAEGVVMELYSKLFTTLMLMVGSFPGVKAPKVEQDGKNEKRQGSLVRSSGEIEPSRIAVDTFYQFLVRASCKEMVNGLTDDAVWEMFEDEEKYPEAFTILARTLAENNLKHIPQIIVNLSSALSSYHEPQRIVTTVFYAELINQKYPEKSGLVESVVNGLLGCMADSCHIVRMYCARGLGNITSMGKDLVQNYSTTILSALMTGLDDKDDVLDSITIEAMRGLSRIMSVIDEEDIRSILINIILKIRPCFEKELPNVRAQAITLFGNLSKFGGGKSQAAFLEQIHTSFVSLLLHLNDPDKDVRKACKFTLRSLGPLLGSESIDNKFQNHLPEDANLFYGEFMNDIAKLIIKDLREKVVQYVTACMSFYNSIWSEIRGNAATFTGFLLGNLPAESQSAISKEHICSALIDLLRDPSPNVRGKTSEAMSLLHEY